MSVASCARDGLASASANVVVHIVDDNSDIRRAATRLIHSLSLATQEHSSGSEFLKRYNSSVPGCVILDICMPGMNGLEVQEALSANELPPPIIFITGQAEIPHAVKAMQGGAVDLLVKPVRAEALLECIFLAVELDLANRRKHAIADDIRARLAQLTDRESEIAKLLSLGESVKHIAHSLGISSKTVDNHRARILDKVNVENATQLANLLAQLP